MIGGIQELSTIDYPGEPAMVLFCKGCDMKCPYCHNMALSRTPDLIADISYASIIERIRRSKVINAIVLSGGEPTITLWTESYEDPGPRKESNIYDVINLARKKRLLVKLDTNGLDPQRLEDVINQRLIDYVAMDIKTYPVNYDVLTESEGDGLIPLYKNKDWFWLMQSLDVLARGKAMHYINYEIRTTCYPRTVRNREVSAIARIIPEDVPYFLQQYRPIRERGPQPYSNTVMQELYNHARRVHKNTQLRGA